MFAGSCVLARQPGVGYDTSLQQAPSPGSVPASLGPYLIQQQQQHNGSGYAHPVGQNLNPPVTSFPQGHGPLQQSFVQPSPSTPLEDVRSSSTPSASQAPSPADQQAPVLPSDFAELSLPQLRVLHAQMMRFVIEGENNLQASSTTGGESDIQRQELRAKLELYNQRLLLLQDFMNAKTRAR